MPDETDDDYMRAVRNASAESLALFSNRGKPERERRVVRAFFRALGIQFVEADLLIGQPEPVDVAALGAKFQVTEVIDERRERLYLDHFVAGGVRLLCEARRASVFTERRRYSSASVAQG